MNPVPAGCTNTPPTTIFILDFVALIFPTQCPSKIAKYYLQMVCKITYQEVQYLWYYSYKYMCVACGLPTTHTMTFTQWLGVASLMSFGLLTFVSCVWIVTSYAFKRRLHALLDRFFPHPPEPNNSHTSSS
jgi:hypothetical protein